MDESLCLGPYGRFHQTYRFEATSLARMCAIRNGAGGWLSRVTALFSYPLIIRPGGLKRKAPDRSGVRGHIWGYFLRG
jgi:hypothetical protein